MRFSRVIKFILIGLIFLLLSIFICKDYIIKNVVLYCIKKNLDCECNLNSINICFSKIIIENLEISNKDFNLILKHGQLDFEFSKFLTIGVLGLTLEGVNLKVNDLVSVKRILLGKNSKTESKYFLKPSLEERPLLLDLKDIKVYVEGANNLELKTGINFRGIYSKDGLPKIETLSVPECKIKIKDFETNFRIVKEEEYKLEVFVLKVNDKKINDLEISFDIIDNIFLIKSVKNDLLGVKPVIKGKLTLESYNDICLEMSVKDVSFRNIVNLFNEDEGVIIKGTFLGEFNVCLNKGKLYQLNGGMYNKSGGGLDIKKDASLGFLRKYLNESSYDALVDNLRNYRYNNAGFEINMDKSKISINLDFRSESMGRRNLMFNLYDNIGVKK